MAWKNKVAVLGLTLSLIGGGVAVASGQFVPDHTDYDPTCTPQTETSTVVTGQDSAHDNGHTHYVCLEGAQGEQGPAGPPGPQGPPGPAGTADIDEVKVDVWKVPEHNTAKNCHRQVFVRVTVNGVTDVDGVRWGGCNKVNKEA